MGCVRGESWLQENKNRLQNYLVALDFHKPVSGDRPLRAQRGPPRLRVEFPMSKNVAFRKIVQQTATQTEDTRGR